MDELSIPCPKCGRVLKIRDRAWLGRKGKCPKCSHAFVLAEPEEVELELAGSEPTAVGTGARWVPDDPTPAPTPIPATRPAAPPPIVTPVIEQPVIAPINAATPSIAAKARKKAKGGWFGIVATIVVVGVAVGGGYFFAKKQFSQQMAAVAPPAAAPAVAATPVAAAETASESAGVANGAATAGSGIAWTESPTSGEPFDLRLVPIGARTVIHMRPAALWAAGSQGEEFRYCLGPVNEFVQQKIQAITRLEPSRIESMLLCLIPGARGTVPEVAAVFRMTETAKKSELLELFGGERVDTYGPPVYLSKGQACLIVDERTIAVCPEALAGEMVGAKDYPALSTDGISELLGETDRDRHFTIVFDPVSWRLDAETMMPPLAVPFFNQFLDWLGNDVETVAWSMHLDKERFFSELLVRNQAVVSPRQLEREMVAKVRELPRTVLNSVRKMEPRERGKRKVIGRVPAMTQAVAMGTITETGPRHVRMVTGFPERAAPNLALGTLLAWDESTRTDFSRELTPSSAPKPAGTKKIPELLADRLKLKVSVDFRRTPLQEAFAYLAEELQTTIELDGDGLKFAGYTKNMPQTFAMDDKPAEEVIKTILKQYDKMCIVLDQPNKTILVTSFQGAEQKNLKPYVFPPE